MDMSPAIGDGYANGNMGPLAVTSIKPALIMYSAAVQLKEVWVAGAVVETSALGAKVLDPVCHSDQYVDSGVHPGDVSLWLCNVDGTGTAYTEVTAEQFSTSCGCPEAMFSDSPVATPSPAAPASSEEMLTAFPVTIGNASVPAGTPAPAISDTPTPMTMSTSPPASGSRELGTSAPVVAPLTSMTSASGTVCPGLDPFSISIALTSLSDIEGCYTETGISYAEPGGHFFSISGNTMAGQMAVFPGYADGASTDPRWYFGYYADVSEDFLVYCVSVESPEGAHPANASWYRDLTGEGIYSILEDELFALECGCWTSTTIDVTTSPTAAFSSSVPTPAVSTFTPTAMERSVSPTLAFEQTAEHTTSMPSMSDVSSAGVDSTAIPTAGSRAIGVPDMTASPTFRATGFDFENNTGVQVSTFSTGGVVGVRGVVMMLASLLAAVI